jgi:hypothetical protein
MEPDCTKETLEILDSVLALPPERRKQFVESRKYGLVSSELEERLELAETRMGLDAAQSQAEFESIREDASARGFGKIAQAAKKSLSP